MKACFKCIAIFICVFLVLSAAVSRMMAHDRVADRVAQKKLDNAAWQEWQKKRFNYSALIGTLGDAVDIRPYSHMYFFNVLGLNTVAMREHRLLDVNLDAVVTEFKVGDAVTLSFLHGQKVIVIPLKTLIQKIKSKEVKQDDMILHGKTEGVEAMLILSHIEGQQTNDGAFIVEQLSGTVLFNLAQTPAAGSPLPAQSGSNRLP